MTVAQVAYGPIIQYSSNALLQSTDQTGLILGTWNKKTEVSMLNIIMNY